MDRFLKAKSLPPIMKMEDGSKVQSRKRVLCEKDVPSEGEKEKKRVFQTYLDLGQKGGKYVECR